MQEVWAPVPEWEGLYEVSNMGRVRSLRKNRGPRKVPRILKPQPTGRQSKKRMSVRLFRAETGVTKFMLVHRLVLMAFVGPCPDGHETRHLNDDPTDNRLGNLCWGTRRQNAADARANGISRAGARNGRALLDADKVRAIRKLRGEVPQQELADRFGVAQTTISGVQTGKLWPHVTDDES